jgi:hypothetical protein
MCLEIRNGDGDVVLKVIDSQLSKYRFMSLD